jgi:hypothetical protein
MAILYQRLRAHDSLCQRKPSEYGKLHGDLCGLRAALVRPLYREYRQRHAALLEIFASDHYADVSLAGWMANTQRDWAQIT